MTLVFVLCIKILLPLAKLNPHLVKVLGSAISKPCTKISDPKSEIFLGFQRVQCCVPNSIHSHRDVNVVWFSVIL